MAQVSAVLARLVRQERAALALLRKAEAPTKGANVHLAEVVDLFPAGVEPGLWASWDEEARYTFHERLGIGDELGMDKSEAHRWAVIEAKLTAADVPRALRPLLGEALEMGFTLEKGPVVESQTKGGTMKDQTSREEALATLRAIGEEIADQGRDPASAGQWAKGFSYFGAAADVVGYQEAVRAVELAAGLRHSERMTAGADLGTDGTL